MSLTIWRGTRIDEQFLEQVNNKLLPRANSASVRSELVTELARARKKLLALTQALAELDSRPKTVGISQNALDLFFQSHPWAKIKHENELSLATSAQPVFFHTRRGSNRVGENDDIIYATLPIHSFQIDFNGNGHVSGRVKEPADWTSLEEHCGFASVVFGHPHVTFSRGSRLFGNTCFGNNRFVQAWLEYSRNGHGRGDTLLRILTQALIWLESANLDDMYNTYLVNCDFSRGIPDYPVEPLTEYLAHGTPIPEDHPLYEMFQKVRDWSLGTTQNSAIWCFWLRKTLQRFAGAGLNVRESLIQALNVDAAIYMFAQSNLLSRYDLAFALGNTRNRKAYAELGGYRPYDRDKCLAESLPDLFPNK